MNGRFTSKYPEPNPGDKFGELTVVRYEYRAKHRGAMVKCSCGRRAYFIQLTQLYYAGAKKCRSCAKKKALHKVLNRAYDTRLLEYHPELIYLRMKW